MTSATAEGPPGKITPSLLPLIGYLAFLYSAWTIWVYTVYPTMVRIGDRTLTYAVINCTCRVLIWVLPVFWYLRYIDQVDPLTYLKLAGGWKRGLLVGLMLSVLNFLVAMLRYGPPRWDHVYLTWNSVVSSSMLIGVVEEIPFRGFILQKLRARYDFWTASIISALLFMGIHIPGYILLHALNRGNLVTIFLFGLVMAAIFWASKTLWSSIVTHSLNDCIAVVVFHL